MIAQKDFERARNAALQAGVLITQSSVLSLHSVSGNTYHGLVAKAAQLVPEPRCADIAAQICQELGFSSVLTTDSLCRSREALSEFLLHLVRGFRPSDVSTEVLETWLAEAASLTSDSTPVAGLDTATVTGGEGAVTVPSSKVST